MNVEKMFESRMYADKDSRFYNDGLDIAIGELVHNPHWPKTSDSHFQKTIKITHHCSERQKKELKICRSSSFNKKSKISRKAMINMILKSSSIYALNRIGNSKSPIRKIFWILVLTLGVAGCVSQVGQFLNSYLKYPVSMNLEVTRAKSMEFPGVTFCNMNSIRKEYEKCLKENLKHGECFDGKKTLKSIASKENSINQSCALDPDELPDKNSDNDWLNLFLSQDYDSRVKYGHQAKDFIKHCTFENKQCDFDSFTLSVSYLYGNCYTFNSDDKKAISESSGPSGGLEVELDLEVDKYSSFTQAIGAKIHIHDPYLNSRVDNKGIVVAPGTENHLAVTKSIYSRLKKPYKDRCRDYTKVGDQERCFELCYHEISLSKCSCSILKHLKNDNIRCNVTNPSVFCCLKRYRKEELCDCPLSCYETQYSVQMSYAAWPTQAYYNESIFHFTKNGTRHELSLEEITRTRVRVKVYYNTMKYTVYQQTSMYERSELISQIGGQMGLWIGLSLAAAFGFLENAIMLCKRK